MAKRQSRSRKQKRHTKKNKTASCGCKKNVRKTRRAGRKSMRGGFIACNDKVITEPGFNVPAFGKAPGLCIPDSKVAMGSSDQVKVDHPMVVS